MSVIARCETSDDAMQVRMLQEQMASLEADVSDMRADLAHLSAQYHSLKAAKGWYFSSRPPSLPVCLPAVLLLVWWRHHQQPNLMEVSWSPRTA